MRSGLPRPHRPNQVITDNYLPLRGPEPPRVEVLTPGAEEVKDILRRWEPFHRGASMADRLGNLYPHIYRVSVVARGLGLREDYTVTLPPSSEGGFSVDYRRRDTGPEPQLRPVDRAGKIGSSVVWH